MPVSKFTDADAAVVELLLQRGHTRDAIAALHGVSSQTVTSVAKRGQVLLRGVITWEAGIAAANARADEAEVRLSAHKVDPVDIRLRLDERARVRLVQFAAQKKISETEAMALLLAHTLRGLPSPEIRMEDA